MSVRRFKLHGLDRERLNQFAASAAEKGGVLEVLDEGRVGVEPEFLVNADDTAILELLSDHALNLGFCQGH